MGLSKSEVLCKLIIVLLLFVCVLFYFVFNIFIRIPNKNKTLQKICLDKKLGVHRMGGKHLHCSISKAEGSGGGGGDGVHTNHILWHFT